MILTRISLSVEQAYVAIAQAIKESHADGTVAKRVDCSVRAVCAWRRLHNSSFGI